MNSHPALPTATKLRSTMAKIVPDFIYNSSMEIEMEWLLEHQMFQHWYREHVYNVDSAGLNQALARSKAPVRSHSDKKKVAFIFFLNDGHTQERLWDDFFAEADEDLYNVYAHRGHASENHTFLQHLPSYHEVSTTKNDWCALMGIEFGGLQAALRDPTNEQFVFVSHNTVPLKNFQFIYDDLVGNSPKTSKFCFTSILGVAKSDCRFQDGRRGESSDVLKHHQWVILSREHADIVVHQKGRQALDRYDELREIKEGVYHDPKMCSDETVPSLALIEYAKDTGRLNPEDTMNALEVYKALEGMGVEQRCTTFVYWDRCLTNTTFDLGVDYSKKVGSSFAHPLPLEDLSQSWLSSLVASPSLLFARKFRPNATVRVKRNSASSSRPASKKTAASLRSGSALRNKMGAAVPARPVVFLNTSGILQKMWRNHNFSRVAVELLSLPRLNLIQNHTELVTSGNHSVLEDIANSYKRRNIAKWDDKLAAKIRSAISDDVEGKSWGAIYSSASGKHEQAKEQ